MSQKQKDLQKFEKINCLLRYVILDMTTVAGSGHPTSSLSAVELMSTLLFSGVFRYNMKDINNPCNDRLIFSKGHASPLYYALWAVAGGIDMKELQNFRKFDSALEGHPTKRFAFTESATGSLGQGLSIGIGNALAQKKLDCTEARTFVLLGDSEMAEGQIWEAMQIASYYTLDNLIAIVDVNRLGQRGETMLGHDIDVYAARVRAFGWRVVTIDGHDIADIHRVYSDVIGVHKKPLMIIAKTFKGKGISFLEDKYSWHGRVLSQQEFADAIRELGDIDFDVRGVIAQPDNCVQKEQSKRQEKKVHSDMIDPHELYATRDGYGNALVAMMAQDKKIVVLDAEVSNSTRADRAKDFFPERFFEMYIAEQNMASVAVGLSQRGYKPFVSSFAAFLTRAHDQFRMASLSDAHMTVVGSHCGVSIGADGASQMGLDDIAMCRALFNSIVFYPSDIVATQKILQITAEYLGISYVRTTREKTPVLYHNTDIFMIGGMHVVHDDNNPIVTIIGAGITVHEALKAAQLLAREGINVRVIDLYCIKPIDAEKLESFIGAVDDIIVVEDHYAEGGIGEAVRSAMGERQKIIHHLSVQLLPRSGTPTELLAYEKINFNAIMEKVYSIINFHKIKK